MSSTRVEDKLIEYEYRCTEYRFAEYEYDEIQCDAPTRNRLECRLLALLIPSVILLPAGASCLPSLQNFSRRP